MHFIFALPLPFYLTYSRFTLYVLLTTCPKSDARSKRCGYETIETPLHGSLCLYSKSFLWDQNCQSHTSGSGNLKLSSTIIWRPADQFL